MTILDSDNVIVWQDSNYQVFNTEKTVADLLTFM